MQSLTPTSSAILFIISLAGMTCEITGRYEKNAAIQLGFAEEHITIFDDHAPSTLCVMAFDYIYVYGGNAGSFWGRIKIL